MTKHLVVNADDYGLCRAISKGILDGFQRGIVTSTSVVTIGNFFEFGLNDLKSSRIDTGIHLTFVDEEKALNGPIEGLTTDQGYFFKSHKQVIPVILSGRYDQKAFEKELFIQTEKMADSHLFISHIDAHQHLHMLPSVFSVVTRIARKFNIKWFRNTWAKPVSLSGIGLDGLNLFLRLKTKKSSLKSARASIGFDTSGFMDEAMLLKLLSHIKGGITELITHPGYDASDTYDWGYLWENELAALTSTKIRSFLKQQKITLTDYQRLQ